METPNSAHDELDEDEELFDDGTAFDVDTDETPHGLDDEEASDLDIGSDLQQTEDTIADGDQALDWDMGGILPNAPVDASDNDDAAGPDGFDPTIGVSELAAENLDDSSLGFEATEALLVPDLSDWRGDDKEQVLFDDRELELPDESSVEDAARSWSACFEQAGRFEALTAADTQLFAGGEQLLVFDAGEFRAVPCPSGLTRLSAFGKAPSSVLGVTKSGLLLQFRAPHYAYPVTLSTASDPDAPRDDGRRPPALVTWSDAACAVLTGAGRLLLLVDGTLRPLLTGTQHPVVQLPVETDRPLVLLRDGRGLCLHMADAWASPEWRTLPVDPRWAKSLAEESFEFAAQGPYIVFAGSRVGVVVLDTRSGGYQRVPGCVGVAALAAGKQGDEPRFWTALSHEIAGRTDLIQIDPAAATATRLASTETVCDDEFAPARSLAWAPSTQILYVAGDFGVKGFRA
ncbi:MAG TPA: hypothetical protein VI197_23050 [Polyangiaceae bacterium]